MRGALAIVRDVFRQARASGLTATLVAVALIAAGVCLTLSASESAGKTQLATGFGTWPINRAPNLTRAVADWEFLVATLVADTGGVLLALIWTAGFLPASLQTQAVSVVLAKPLGRTVIFIARFAGVLIYVTFFAAGFVGLSYFAIGIRTGVWNAGFWIAVPLMVLQFGVFYSFSALLAVMSRTTTVCIVGSIVFWGLCWGMNFGRHVLVGVKLDEIQRAAGGLSRIVDLGYWIVPKPADFSLVLADALGADPTIGGWTAFQAVRQAGQFYPLASVLSSVAAGAVILSLAAYEFVHDEY
jgi:hypothetical protein